MSPTVACVMLYSTWAEPTQLVIVIMSHVENRVSKIGIVTLMIFQLLVSHTRNFE